MSAIFRQASSAFAGVGASGSALLREAAPQAVVRSARASKPLARFTSRSIRPPRPLPRVGLQEEGCPLAVAGSSERLAMMPAPMADPALTTTPVRGCRTQRVQLPGAERTWTVVDVEHRVVEPAEQFLEYERMLARSPNTVKSYARALALWWQFLTIYELPWDAVKVEDLGRFLGWLRTGDSPALVSIERRSARFSESTIALRGESVRLMVVYWRRMPHLPCSRRSGR